MWIAESFLGQEVRLGKHIKDLPFFHTTHEIHSAADYETCYDEYHMHWVNGVCRNGVKEEMNELHRCAMFSNSPLDIEGRRYCHTCETTDGKVRLQTYVSY